MRAITAKQQAVLDSGTQSDHVRVSIKDSGGTFRDLTTYPGFNAIKTLTWHGNIDDPHTTCDISLHREMFKLSLAPYVGGSALNRGYDPSASPVALIALNRELLIEVAVVPTDKQPASGDWFEVFRGRVDSVDTASGYDIKVGARDLGGRLAQQFIKTELVYSYAAVAGVSKALRIWEPQIPVVLNVTYLLPASRGTTDPGINKFFKCSQSGTTGTAEPTWSTGTGIVDGSAKWDYVAAPTTSGNPVEQVMQNILNDHKASGDPTVTLYTPTSPSWAIRQYIQRREFVLDAVRTLARQIGWDVRYKWRAGTAQFEFTFSQPERTSPSVDFTFGVAEYMDPKKLATDIATIRNSWRVIYSDASDLFPDGTPKRKVIEVNDSASITKYGELWSEIQEDEASNIDSSTEATSLANAALSDCKEPTAEMSIPLSRGFPWVEVNDYYTFTANGLHFDADQSLAVTSWSHSYDAGESIRSTIEVRGLPTLGARTWLDMSVHTAQPPASNYPPLRQHFNGTETTTVTMTPTVGGTLATANATTEANHLTDDDAEFHIYPISGTVLDNTTLKSVGKTHNKATHAHSDLVPRKTYFTKVVPRSYSKGKIIRGQPSAEVSFVAGQAKAGHYSSGSTPGLLPLNGNFEHLTDPDAPFDQWDLAQLFGDAFDNRWSANDGVWYGTDSDKGQYLSLRTGINDPQRGAVASTLFEIRRGAYDVNFYISLRKNSTSANANDSLWMRVDCFSTYSGSSVSSASFEFPATGGGTPSDNTWYNLEFGMDPGLLPIPANINFLQITLYRGTTTTDDYGNVIWDIGDVYCETTGNFSARFGSLAVLGAAEIGGVVTFDDQANFFGALNLNGQRIQPGAAAPVAGAWVVGDIVINSAPVAGGFIGWVCTTAGTPGTWKTFGAISP